MNAPHANYYPKEHFCSLEIYLIKSRNSLADVFHLGVHMHNPCFLRCLLLLTKNYTLLIDALILNITELSNKKFV